MSLYGVEVTSDTGYKFIIPDYNPFVFHSRHDIGVNMNITGTDSQIVVPVPAGSRHLAFFKIISNNVANSATHPMIMTDETPGGVRITARWSTGRSIDGYAVIRVYLFIDKEVHAPDGVYGIQIFDASGNQVLVQNSRSLRINRMTPTVSVDVGFPVACTCTALGTASHAFAQPPVGITEIFTLFTLGEGNSIQIRRSFTQAIPTMLDANRWRGGDVLYINTNYYD